MIVKDKEVMIKLIVIDEFLHNKKVLIDMLRENLEINFPDRRNFEGYAEDSYEKMKAYLLSAEAILIGAFEEDKLIGFLWAYEKEIIGEKSIHIGHIVVMKNVRSSGIGTKLISFLEVLAVNKDIHKIDLITTLQNKKTVEFYKARGYSEVRVQFEKEIGEKIVDK